MVFFLNTLTFCSVYLKQWRNKRHKEIQYKTSFKSVSLPRNAEVCTSSLCGFSGPVMVGWFSFICFLHSFSLTVNDVGTRSSVCHKLQKQQQCVRVESLSLRFPAMIPLLPDAGLILVRASRKKQHPDLIAVSDCIHHSFHVNAEHTVHSVSQ